MIEMPAVLCRSRHELPLSLSRSEPEYNDQDALWFEYDEDAPHSTYSWALQDYR